MNKINNKDLQSFKSWPFVQANEIINRNGGSSNFKLLEKKCIIFETGYGPSGLPHIGTFGEVVELQWSKTHLKL